MSVRRKAAIITALTVLVFLSLVTWVAEAIVLRGFEHLQKETTATDVRRVANALDDDLTDIEATAQDWAYWDDTYLFVSGGKPEYPKENLSQDTLAVLKLSFLALADTHGRVVFSKGCDLSTGQTGEAPASVTALLSREDVATVLTTAILRKGVVLLPEGPALVVAAPILRNDRSGPPAGIHLVGRLLTPGQLARMSEQTQLAVTVAPLTSDRPPGHLAGAGPSLGPEDVEVEILGPDTIGGYALLRDPGGVPVAVVRVEEPRTVYAHGQNTVKYALLTLALGIALAGGVNYLMLEKAVVWRLARLTARLQEIGRSHDTAARVPVLGRDEIGALAGSINQMLTDRERAENVIRHQAFYDGLTGLSNRALFYTEVNEVLAEHAFDSDHLAVLCLDLDRFKMVNDTFGHHHGDELLQLVAQRLQQSLRDDDLACRLGGDEFAVLLPRVRAPQDAAGVARRIVQAFQRPFVLDGHELYVSASVGVSLYPKDGRTTGQLLQKADLAMYETKQAGGNGYEFHGAHMDGRASQRLGVEEDLRRALRKRELAVFYQP